MNSAIDYNTLNFSEIIANGTYGAVFKANWLNKVVAVKKLLTDFNNEREHSQANHENIIFLYGLAMHDNMAYLVMEYADGGPLHNIIHSDQITYEIAHVINWALQIAKAIAYLHAKEPKAVVHRDLSPTSILLSDSHRCVKISDFSQATYVSPFMKSGTVSYIAPEVFFNNVEFTKKCDNFSFAIILWEMLSRDVPYKRFMTPVEKMLKINYGERPSLNNLQLECPDSVKELMTNCWKENANERFSMADVIGVLSNYPIDLEALRL